MSQAKTPIIDALRHYTTHPHAPFYTPGHKRGSGIARPLADLFGNLVFQADLPELPALDNLYAPEGAIREAQQLAAEAFGADETWFLVNGSTAGAIAAILATCTSGQKIILPRNIHSSAISGLVLSGAIPIFVNPEYDPNWDMVNSVTPASIQEALLKHPDTKAVMMVYPTYQGVCGDVRAIADICHQHDLPLIVDEAHGPHFHFHSELPPSALSCGADIAIQSIHKVLGAMTQASMIHVKRSRIDPKAISRALQLIQSTSPSYLLLASLDAARHQMAISGQELISRTLHLAERAKEEIEARTPFRVLQPKFSSGFSALDPTRLSINVSDCEFTGYEVDRLLHDRHGVIAELPSAQYLTFIISIGNTEADIDQLVTGLSEIYRDRNLEKAHGEDNNVQQRWQEECLFVHPSSFLIRPALSPRQAFFSSTETLPIEQTDERISAEMICPYPPGIPAIMPGEMINMSALDYLQQVLALGGTITGCSDPTLKTLKVVRQ
ncbi:aminotransferase class I/II-fold pyridoxal phosphate-dependent enzyme [Roseofilum casamattae]|uniref:Aminotransferase class I/II-fold pyridoxal phosphate-dependent enzyme n=1 Tax=Roseofilum casamattae BLCC-M143 TaxID=3022442 RepID=A0ABT7C4L5_9CYAN|nr:aminotransferase class I/II-fold pyridoxal phosphate-dependent enzyme [Roseofilum casamattae]MDJ1185841.1 aminotransferase class I/II-fold pyridoxal phosphate-dependent enzyme [Roseofilum casamattae BLCC-M143]